MGGRLHGPLLCPTRGDAWLCEATASPQSHLRTGCTYTTSIPTMCPASPGASSQPFSLASCAVLRSLLAVLLPLPASLGKPSQWANAHLDTQTSGQLAKPHLRNRVYSCMSQVLPPIKCIQPASTGEKHPSWIPLRKRCTRVRAGDAQYLCFAVECSSSFSGVMSGQFHISESSSPKSTHL